MGPGSSKTVSLLSMAFCLAAGIALALALRPHRALRPSQNNNRGPVIETQQLGDADPDDLAAGKLLIASRDLRDPNFAEAVILIVGFEDDGALGLVLNRPTKVSLGRVFPEHRQAKGMTEPVYAGGPVERTGIMALLRSREKQEESERICAGVYFISNREVLEKTVAAGTQANAFRAYAGYAGWGPNQLEEEVDAGAWHLFPADANSIFDSDPDSQWSRLINRVEVRIARSLPPQRLGNFCARQQNFLETTYRFQRHAPCCSSTSPRRTVRQQSILVIT
jgi:putative transcriptional regulator